MMNVFGNAAMTVILGLAVGLPLGFALQKGSFCMNTAFRSIVFEKDHSTLRAYVLILLINIIGVAILSEFFLIFPQIPPFYWLAVMIGSFLFGVGMVLAGGCVSGTWYRTGKGMLGSFVALIGFSAGATATANGALRPIREALQGPLIDVYGEEATLVNLISFDHPWIKWPIIALLCICGLVFLLRAPKPRFVIGWKWWVTGSVIGVIALASWWVSSLTYRDYGLSIVQPSVSLVRWFIANDQDGINWATFVLIGLPFGAAAAAIKDKDFSLRIAEPRRVLVQFGGGVLMGFGASLAGGCNIGHGISGVATLSIASIVATILTMVGVWSMTAIVYRQARNQKVRVN